MKKIPQKSLRFKGFELAYRTFAKPLMKFIVRKAGGDTDAAEEVFSRTTYAALNGWHTFAHKSSYFTWLCKIALNKMADYWRERVNERSRFVAPALEQISKIPSSKLSPEETLALKELKEAVHECLLLIPEETRRILYLRYFEEMTLKKIAVILKISERAAEGKLYRAKKAFMVSILASYPDMFK